MTQLITEHDKFCNQILKIKAGGMLKYNENFQQNLEINR